MRLPGVAPGHPPWRGDILAVKSQPQESKRARSALRSSPMFFQERTNTSCYLAIPTHGFTVVLSVFRGTPPAKPLKCKSVSNRLGARFRQRPRTPVESLGFPAPEFVWCCRTSSRRHFLSAHSALPFVIEFRFPSGFAWAIKNPASIRYAGFRNPLSGSFTCSPSIYPNRLWAPARNMTWIVRG